MKRGILVGWRANPRKALGPALLLIGVAAVTGLLAQPGSIESGITDFFTLTVAVSVPYILGGQGMTLAGKSGIFLVFNEGVMLASASSTFLVAYLTGGNILIGLVAGSLMAGLFGVIMSFFSVTLKQNQFIIGLTLYVAATGIADFMYTAVVGVTLTPPQVPVLAPIHLAFLSDIPFFGSVLFGQNWMFYFALLVSFALWYFLYRTRYGLNLRSVGENPRVADGLGINVARTRYLATVVGSMIMGLGGSYLLLYFSGTFTPSLVSGRGFIIIALTFFGQWSPLSVVLAAFVFAGAEVFSIYGQVLNLPIPYQFLLMVPFILTLLILLVTYGRTSLPRGLGSNYDRESIER